MKSETNSSGSFLFSDTKTRRSFIFWLYGYHLCLHDRQISRCLQVEEYPSCSQIENFKFFRIILSRGRRGNSQRLSLECNYRRFPYFANVYCSAWIHKNNSGRGYYIRRGSLQGRGFREMQKQSLDIVDPYNIHIAPFYHKFYPCGQIHSNMESGQEKRHI